MTELLPDVWASRDYPVLCEVARRFEAGATTVGIHDVMTALNLDERTATAAAIALRARGYVMTQAMDRWEVFDFTRLNGAAYLATGLHPDGDDAASRLIDALRQAAEQTGDEAERGRLRQAADAIGGLSRDVAAAVLTVVLTRGLG